MSSSCTLSSPTKHTVSFPPHAAAGCLPLRYDETINTLYALVMNEWRPGEGYVWHICGGKVENDETPQDTAIRESHEEMGGKYTGVGVRFLTALVKKADISFFKFVGRYWVYLTLIRNHYLDTLPEEYEKRVPRSARGVSPIEGVCLAWVPLFSIMHSPKYWKYKGSNASVMLQEVVQDKFVQYRLSSLLKKR
jgi:8-oxo-dGTP pyrophosphatase MutT (NUDIX family)